MTAGRAKRTKTTVNAGPAAQWLGRVNAADRNTIGSELNLLPRSEMRACRGERC